MFFDELALLIPDPDHSEDEDRFVLLGMSATFRTLIVCHCYREEGQVIRVVSARKANRLYLRECAASRKRLSLAWKVRGKRRAA